MILGGSIWGPNSVLTAVAGPNAGKTLAIQNGNVYFRELSGFAGTITISASAALTVAAIPSAVCTAAPAVSGSFTVLSPNGGPLSQFCGVVIVGISGAVSLNVYAIGDLTLSAAGTFLIPLRTSNITVGTTLMLTGVSWTRRRVSSARRPRL
jgi:hypothetical protein